jgi:uncharacterized Zn-binding protein involved in type VI secretion
MGAHTRGVLGVIVDKWEVIMLQRRLIAVACALAMGWTALPALAQSTSEGTPNVVIEGSGNTVIGGQAATRKGDRTDGANAVVEGSPDVFINGRPAARAGDKTGCGGIVIGGGSNVFINGRPAAATGDLTTGCPGK